MLWTRGRYPTSPPEDFMGMKQHRHALKGIIFIQRETAVAFARKVQRKVNANDNFAYAKMAA